MVMEGGKGRREGKKKRTDRLLMNARVPSSPPTLLTTSPFSNTFSPGLTSLPSFLTFSPLSTCAKSLTSTSSPFSSRETTSVSSTMMQASMPGQRGAPVLMR